MPSVSSFSQWIFYAFFCLIFLLIKFVPGGVCFPAVYVLQHEKSELCRDPVNFKDEVN